MSSDTQRKAKRTTSEDTDELPESSSAIGGLFTSRPSLPSSRTVVSSFLGILLFGGLTLMFGGATLFALNFGVEVALWVVGVALLVVAFVVAQIAARAGVI